MSTVDVKSRVGEPFDFVSFERESERSAAAVGVDIADRSRSIEQMLVDGWLDGRLRGALKHLPPAYRMVVVMREIEGLSTKEVAAIAGLSEANVKQRLHRARLMMRTSLEQV